MSLETDSYVTIAEADSYWSDRNDSDWAAASTAQKTAALIRATEFIDNSFEWVGSIADKTQKLAWPRINAVDKEGRTIDSATIPEKLKNAVSWLAKYALNAELDPAASRGGAIKAVKAGSVEVEWTDDAPSKTTYDHVYKILKNLTIGGKNQINLIRV